MCIDCGCPTTGAASPPHHHDHEHEPAPRTLCVEEDLLAKNDRLAAGNRAHFQRAGVFVLNLVSSPGSGKTTLLERTLRELNVQLRFAVVEGDQQTSRDAERIAATGVPVRQINTGAGCHLDAHMVGHAVEAFDLAQTDLLMIENVGNLVCPASFDLGEDHKVALLSVTEGEDKPLKYPQMFRAATLMIINKTDLLPYIDFDLNRCRDFARQVNPKIEILELSCRSGAGMAEWYDWLAAGVREKREASGVRSEEKTP
ncbi:MAG: hydrogenase nickel incorporation protein HypB [Desulfuromonadales bacterium]|nr:hydrogenase nickel incorporation protein HypB [Desulfuromonadales bacterium]